MLAHTKVAKKFYKSKAWRDCRASYITKVYGLCERCEAPGDIVHHKEHINADNMNNSWVLLNHENLELLCIACHNREHFKTRKAMRDGYGFDENGNLIEL